MIDTTTVPYGTVPAHADATKAATAEFTYTFAGWDPEVVAVTGTAEYTATFTAATNSYTITWKNDDGSEIDTTEVAYGQVPTHADATKAATAEFTYTFAGWDPEVVAVTGAAEYTATFTAATNSYTITWKNDDGTEIDTTEVAYGQVPTHADATKAATAEFTYTFAGWDPEVVAVTGAAEYTATFTAATNSYTITWKNDDGSEIDTTEVAYGQVPTHADATKAATAEFTYTFAGWDPEVVAVTGEASYQATFTSTVNQYTVVFEDDDGTELSSEEYAYGTAAADIVKPADPTKAYDGTSFYEFAGWTPPLAEVTTNAAYTASYTSIAPAAAIGGTPYPTIQAAVDAAAASGDTIVILRDVDFGHTDAFTTSVTVDGKAVEVDLAGFEITGEYAAGRVFQATNGAALTISDSSAGQTGAIAALRYDQTSAAVQVTEHSKVIIEGGNLQAYTYAVDAADRSDVEVNGGVLSVTGSGNSALWLTGMDVTCTVNGGSITGTGYGISAFINANLTVNGGTIASTGANGAAVKISNGCQVDIADGDFSGSYALRDTSTTSATVSITDGKFSGSTDLFYPNDSGKWTATLSGGIYSADPSDGNGVEIAYDYAVVENGDPDTAEAYPYAVVRTYTVTFVDEDGTTVLLDAAPYPVGTAAADIEQPETPTKASTAQYTYTFAGWTPTLDVVTEDVTYTATYTPTLRSYTVTWLDGDGEVLKTDTLAYGATPAYSGATPTKTATDQYSYEFNDTWTPAIEVVTGPATYTAQFDASVNQYTVTFEDEDGTELSSAEYAYGTSADAIVKPDDPTKDGDAQYTWTFSGWNPEVAGVTTNATYRATYSPTVNQYDVTFTWHGGATTNSYAYGTAGADVVVPADPAGYTENGTIYTFTGWNPTTVAEVTAAATYAAQYSSATAVAQVGDASYASLAEAIEAVADGGTITMLADHNVGSAIIQVNTKSFTVVLNGTMLSSSEDDNIIFRLSNGQSITIDGTAEGSTMLGTAMIASYSEGHITVNGGTYENDRYCPFYANGTCSADSTIEISDSDEETGFGLYIAGPAAVTLTDTEITAVKTGVEIRAGSLDIDGCTIAANGAFSTNPNGNGGTVYGAAIAVSPHNTDKPIAVTVTGGTFTAEKAVYENYIESSPRTETTAITLAGGTFDGEIDIVEDIGTVIPADSAALFSDADAGGVPEGYALVESATPGFYEIAKVWTVVYQNDDGTELQKFENVVDGDETPAYTGATPEKAADAQYTYTFKDWGTVAATVTEDATYTAAYTETVRNYTVTFNDEDGTEISSTDYAYGTAATNIVVPADPTKAADEEFTYTFAGWNPAIDVVTEDAVYTASYTPSARKRQTVTFKAQGGTCDTDTMLFDVGGKYAGLPEAEREGYIFLGWFAGASRGNQVTTNHNVTTADSRTLWAHWSEGWPEQQTVWFQLQGGTCGKSKMEFDFGGRYEGLPEAEREGYVFLGWFTAKEGGNRVKANNNVTASLSRTLWAHWAESGEAGQQTVRFNAQGGTCAMSEMQFVFGGKYAGLPVAERDGYTFLGWFSKSQDGNQVKENSNVTEAPSRTLWAHWSETGWPEQQTVRFNAQGGTCDTDTMAFDFGGKYEGLPVAEREGFTFLGWFSKSQDGNQVKENNNVTAALSRTLWAHWGENPSAGTLSISSFSLKSAGGISARGTRGGNEQHTGSICFEAVAGRTYELQWTPSLGGEWMTLRRWVADADGASRVDLPVLPGETTGFFRLATPSALGK